MRQFSINKDEQPVLKELQSQTRLIKKIEFWFDVYTNSGVYYGKSMY